MRRSKINRTLFSMLLIVFVSFALIGCKKDTLNGYTYNIYTDLSPSNWNELTYQNNNDVQIMNYIGSSFFQFNFKYDNNGKIINGEFEVEYAAATKLEDVSTSYVGEKWGIEEGAKNRAFKITLREDLRWDDGTPIKAGDFVYTMKEQLDPLAQHYRADSFYLGSTVIHNAEKYVKQGKFEWTPNGDDVSNLQHSLDSLVKGTNGVYNLPNGKKIKFSFNDELTYLDGDKLNDYSEYLDEEAYNALIKLADEEGRVDVSDATIALFEQLINADNWGNETAEYIQVYMVYENEYAAMNFDQVGIFAPSDYSLVVILDKELPLLTEDGMLTYQAAYNMSSLPLVKKDLFETNKVAPQVEGGLWTSTYNSSIKSSASWGPYKLTKFQAGKEYVLDRNQNWFGYTANLYPGQYQTDRIHAETIKEWNTAWLKFQAGEIDNIGIDVSIATDYKSSERAYFTPDDFVASLQLQSNKEALKNRETEGFNKTILSYLDFRKALSLSINRAEFAAQTTTSSLAGFGLFNSMHYYDVPNGRVYRNEAVAKEVLCDIYGINPNDYNTLEEAEKAITGLDLVQARQLVTSAYNEALAAGDIKATDKVKLTMGTGTINESVTRRFDYLKNAWLELVKTTPLEGRLEFEVVDKGESWANDFRSGGYDIVMGGWTGAAWNPGYFLLAYLSPNYMYSKAWKTDEAMLTFTMPGVGENGEDITDTLSLIKWYNCLNGVQGAKYNWGQGSIDESKRLLLIAALEKEVLKVYYTVPLYNNFAASLNSYKVDYTTYTYNTFMSYGGIRYMTYNYDDAAWAKLVKSNNGELNYKS